MDLRTTTMDGKTFLLRTLPCDCGSMDFSYEPRGPHIAAICNECGKVVAYVEQVNSARWNKLVKERANYVCERCGKPLTPRTAVAHHKLPQWYMPELALSLDNGICLCKDCHKQIHGDRGTIKNQ